MIHSKTILIVDDEPRSRQGLKKTLEVWSAGKFEIVSAEGGDEALEILNEQKIHLLITDIRMPRMTGLKLINILNSKKYKPAVIIISGYSDFDYAQEAISLGVSSYLLKPINKRKLIEAVEKAIEAEANRERAEIVKKVVDDRLIDVQKEDHSTRPLLQDALRFINQNLNERLSLRQVAEHVHLNASYFSVFFKEQTNLTFSEYVTRRRLQNAKNLLLTTNLTVAETGEEVGYQTTKYFVKLFKQYEGITPNQYRKNSENGGNQT